VSIADSIGPLTISDVYFPPGYTVKQAQFDGFYNTLGQRFIVGGDYNAKHTDWGSRLVTPKGYLSDVFQPHLPKTEPEVEETLIQLLEAPYQLEPLIKHLTSAAVQEVITSLNPKKASGYDVITGKILKELT
jgi:hypothetical protein